MPKYDVHVYAMVAIKVPDVKAKDTKAAAAKALTKFDSHNLLSQTNPTKEVAGVSFVDAFEGFIVDEQGDDGKQKTRHYKCNEAGKIMPYRMKALSAPAQVAVCVAGGVVSEVVSDDNVEYVVLDNDTMRECPCGFIKGRRWSRPYFGSAEEKSDAFTEEAKKLNGSA